LSAADRKAPTPSKVSGASEQNELFDLPAFCPILPPRGSAAETALNDLLARDLTQLEWLQDGNGWRLAAAVKELDYLGWEPCSIRVKCNGWGRPTARYSFQLKRNRPPLLCASKGVNMRDNIDRARSALKHLDPNCDRPTWVKIGMASHATGLPFDDFNDWSAGADSYNAQAARATWRSFKAAPGGVGAGALFGMARDAGWQDGNTDRPAPARATPKPAEPPRKPSPGNTAPEVFARCEPAINQHGYIARKQGTPEGLRVVAAGDRLTIAGQHVAGFLAVPAYAPDGEIQSIQFIPPAAGKKLNLPGASMAGASFTIGSDGPVYLCEGIGAAWSAWQSTAALPYMHARKGEAGAKSEVESAAKKAAGGKYAASRAPVRLVT